MESNRAIYLRLTLWNGVQLVTGATVPLSVRRLSDGQWWNGAAWQAGYIAVNMTEETGNDGVEGSYIYTAIGVQPRDHYVARALYTFAGDANATPFEAEWQTSHEPVTLFTGTVVSATSTTVTLDAGAPATVNYLNGAYIEIVEGTGAGQSGRWVSAYTVGRQATVEPQWVTTPDATSKYKVRPAAPITPTAAWLALVIAKSSQSSVDAIAAKLPAGLVSSQDEVLAIQNNTRVRVVLPPNMGRPDSGSTAYALDLYIYDQAGGMEVPDATPTITAKNEAGTDRSGNLSAVTNPATGKYTVTYTVADSHLIEQIRFEWSIVEGGSARIHGGAVQIVDTTAVDYTAADRSAAQASQAKVDTLHDSRLTTARAGNLDNLDTAVSGRAAPGDVMALSGLTRALLVDDIHDEQLSGHATAGSAGKALTDAAAAEANIRGADSDTLKTLSDQVDGITGITPQAVRDAMKLSPTAGAPAAGSVDEHLDEIATAVSQQVNVILGPVVTSKDPGNRLSAPLTLEMFESEAKDFAFTIQDIAGAPVDLSGMTLRLVVHDNSTPPVPTFKVEAPDIVVSGDDNEVATVTVSAAKSTDIARTLYFELWNVDGDAVLSHGPFITRPAEKDVP